MQSSALADWVSCPIWRGDEQGWSTSSYYAPQRRVTLLHSAASNIWARMTCKAEPRRVALPACFDVCQGLMDHAILLGVLMMR